MTPDQLLDIFYGEEYLVLVCNARKFKKDKEDFVSFWVGKYIVRVGFKDYRENNTHNNNTIMDTRRICIDIRMRKGNLVIYTAEFFPQTDDLIREAFSKFTGLYLDF